MLPIIRSLLGAPGKGPEEITTILAAGSRFRVERIDSHGVASPVGLWYDQEDAEWVALLRGNATLEFSDGQRSLQTGDCLLIAPHRKHRVASTSSDAVWLAVHFCADKLGPEC